MKGSPLSTSCLFVAFNRALIGHASTQLRCVTASLKPEGASLSFYFDGELSDIEEDTCTFVTRKMTKNLSTNVQGHSIRCDFPQPLPQKELYLFLRDESAFPNPPPKPPTPALELYLPNSTARKAATNYKQLFAIVTWWAMLGKIRPLLFAIQGYFSEKEKHFCLIFCFDYEAVMLYKAVMLEEQLALQEIKQTIAAIIPVGYIFSFLIGCELFLQPNHETLFLKKSAPSPSIPLSPIALEDHTSQTQITHCGEQPLDFRIPRTFFTKKPRSPLFSKCKQALKKIFKRLPSSAPATPFGNLLQETPSIQEKPKQVAFNTLLPTHYLTVYDCVSRHIFTHKQHLLLHSALQHLKGAPINRSIAPPKDKFFSFFTIFFHSPLTLDVQMVTSAITKGAISKVDYLEWASRNRIKPTYIEMLLFLNVITYQDFDNWMTLNDSIIEWEQANHQFWTPPWKNPEEAPPVEKPQESEPPRTFTKEEVLMVLGELKKRDQEIDATSCLTALLVHNITTKELLDNNLINATQAASYDKLLASLPIPGEEEEEEQPSASCEATHRPIMAQNAQCSRNNPLAIDILEACTQPSVEHVELISIPLDSSPTQTHPSTPTPASPQSNLPPLKGIYAENLEIALTWVQTFSLPESIDMQKESIRLYAKNPICAATPFAVSAFLNAPRGFTDVEQTQRKADWLRNDRVYILLEPQEFRVLARTCLAKLQLLKGTINSTAMGTSLEAPPSEASGLDKLDTMLALLPTPTHTSAPEESVIKASAADELQKARALLPLTTRTSDFEHYGEFIYIIPCKTFVASHMAAELFLNTFYEITKMIGRVTYVVLSAKEFDTFEKELHLFLQKLPPALS